MSRSWNLLILPALSMAVAIWLLSGPAARPPAAQAADCTADDTGTLVIRITDIATDSLLPSGGTSVLIDPDPRDFELDNLVTDSDIDDAGALQDSDEAPGVIRFEDACSTEGNETYTATIYGLPTGLEECEILSTEDETELEEGETAELELEVDCKELLPTPTPQPTSTAQPSANASSVLVNVSGASVSCGESVPVTVLVLDAAGQPVAGAGVAVAASVGSISPSSGHVTNAGGVASMMFVAPAGAGGAATITAGAGQVSGSTQVSIACVTEVLASAPQSAPGSVAGNSQIKPPNTGDAGLLP